MGAGNFSYSEFINNLSLVYEPDVDYDDFEGIIKPLLEKYNEKLNAFELDIKYGYHQGLEIKLIPIESYTNGKYGYKSIDGDEQASPLVYDISLLKKFIDEAVETGLFDVYHVPNGNKTPFKLDLVTNNYDDLFWENIETAIKKEIDENSYFNSQYEIDKMNDKTPSVIREAKKEVQIDLAHNLVKTIIDDDKKLELLLDMCEGSKNKLGSFFVEYDAFEVEEDESLETIQDVKNALGEIINEIKDDNEFNAIISNLDQELNKKLKTTNLEPENNNKNHPKGQGR